MKAKIRVGTAGWSYNDWNGIVYPANSDSKFDRLYYIASYFDAVEINSSFYGPPSVKTTTEWVKRIEYNSSFKISTKLFQGFTHIPRTATREDELKIKQGLEPLINAGRLAAVVVQFPQSFKRLPENRKYLSGLLERFKDYPLVLEVKDSSWNERSVYESLEDRNVGFCNIDQPIFSHSLKPSSFITSQIGYVRMHGRNYENWYHVLPGTCCKHNYFYSEDELNPWIERIREMQQSVSEIYVFMINTCRGQGAANALQIMAAIEKRKVKVPEPLKRKYPQLEKIAA